MGWIAILAALLFAVAFPRGAAAVACIIAAAVGLLVWNNQQKIEEEKARQSLVRVFAEKGVPAALCNAERPVRIDFINGTDREVLNLHFRIVVTRRGYSTELTMINNDLTIDKILPPNDGVWACFRLPELRKSVPLSELDIVSELIGVEFGVH